MSRLFFISPSLAGIKQCKTKTGSPNIYPLLICLIAANHLWNDIKNMKKQQNQIKITITKNLFRLNIIVLVKYYLLLLILPLLHECYIISYMSL